MKQWSLENVAIQHGYSDINPAKHHLIFKKWISDNFTDKISLIDIGGGNGRILLDISDNIKEYWCLDINKFCLNVAKNKFKNDNYHFKLFDIDTDPLNIKVDVIYIDSVLSMLENPFNSIKKCLDCSEYLFINRLKFDTETQKNFYKWGGMQKESVNWSFCIDDFKNLSIENNLELQVYNISNGFKFDEKFDKLFLILKKNK